MELGCSFATTLSTPDHIAIAEDLGYTATWCFYSPAIYADPWMMLALAAERTSRVNLGVCVVVPRFQHVMDVAVRIATLTALAPERTSVVVGSGFSSVALAGIKGTPWSSVETFVNQLKALLAGQEIDTDVGRRSLLHKASTGIEIPAKVPVWLAAHGPKAFGVAQRVADGVISNPTHGEDKKPFDGHYAISYYGTVLEDGEEVGDAAVIERIGPAAALALHFGAFGPLADTPEGRGFMAEIEQLPEEDRLVAVHGGHLMAMTELDRKYTTGNVVRAGTMSGTPAEIHETLDAAEASGATRFCYTPVGSDIPRELEAFAKVFHSR
ncbi:LLM class flavin-dependent oxidoreductase [Rhodococcus sp. LB1]|uniref:LLM class flavin-dependent oxidoreductase n=1 Tax=Rhodococcus sp. LB1 TaxID=1807499 RepID=UPI00077A3C12|nr:LLM class flavin-dependent oxidoreductase [Rhodococcus sp. LB1]KXX55886.1 hypothetical protein AZG88_02315 [Rhodococcus sp. LB1]